MSRLKTEDVIDSVENYFGKVKFHLDATKNPFDAITSAPHKVFYFKASATELALEGRFIMEEFRGCRTDADLLNLKNNAGDRTMIIDLRNLQVHEWRDNAWWMVGNANQYNGLRLSTFYTDKINRHVWFRSNLGRFVQVVAVTAP